MGGEGAGLGVGVIGCGGHVTSVLLPGLRAAGLRPVAVCARTPGVAKRVARRYGVASAFTSAEALCANPHVRAIVVAVPCDQFGAVLDVALAHGKPIYAEKPAADGSAEAHRLARAAQAEGVPVMVGYMKRFAPAYVRLKQVLDDGEIGGPTLARLRWAMGPFGGGRPLDDWFLENGVHLVDLLLWLLGPPAALTSQVSGHDGQHVVLAHGRSVTGTAFSLDMCTTGPWWHDNEQVEVFGMGSSARVDNAVESVVCTPDGRQHRDAPNFTIPVERNLTGTLTGFVPALEAFAQVAVGAPSPCSLDDAARTLALAERLIRRDPEAS